MGEQRCSWLRGEPGRYQGHGEVAQGYRSRKANTDTTQVGRARESGLLWVVRPLEATGGTGETRSPKVLVYWGTASPSALPYGGASHRLSL